MATKTQAVTGVTLSYEERGTDKPGRPPVVLLHGFPLDSRMWEAQLPVLADAGRREEARPYISRFVSTAPEGIYGRDIER